MFPESIPATNLFDGHPVMLLGMADSEHLLYVTQMGRLEVGPLDAFRVEIASADEGDEPEA